MHRTHLAATLPAVLALAAASANAQTTHFVSVSGTAFSPADIVIEVGDTVQWDWGLGIHSVESGAGGVSDGNFSSGAPVGPPHSFSVTFDQAFLTANPMPGDFYPYFCAVHVAFGMEGSVQVCASASAAFRNDSGNTNLATYLNVNPPVLGGPWSSTIDVSSHAGAAGALIVGYAGPLEFPSSWGWILVDVTDPAGQLVQVAGFGAGLIAIDVPLPADPDLCGVPVATQGVVFGGGIELTNAQDLVVGL
ncbi:MAG: plastocyanin/azurin family copper-binding protein [Planctomycetota bacterium]